MGEMTYRVIGGRSVLGRRKGERVSGAELEAAGAFVPALVEGGHLAVVEESKGAKPVKKENGDG